MGTGMDKHVRAINGTHGEMWIDSEYVGECFGCQAKYQHEYEDIRMCRTYVVGGKYKGSSGEGNLKMYKTNSRMGILLSEKMKRGETPTFTIISHLDDPDAYGAERVALYGVVFTALEIVNWEANVVARLDVPFKFSDHEYLDIIEVV